MRKMYDFDVERMRTARKVGTAPCITAVPISSSAWSVRACRVPGVYMNACAT